MDYADDVKYPQTCKKACEKGIIINTIQCGGDPQCQKHWREICAKAEGSYAQIAQEGGVVAVASPYDRELAEINGALARSTLAYGGGGAKAEGLARARAAEALPAMAAADRGGYAAKAGRIGTYDLLDAVKAKKVKVEDLKPEELPEEMKNMSAKERKEFLEKVEKKREELRQRALELDKKRSDFIQKKLAETKTGKDGFDEQVLQTLRKQAKRVDIDY
jgi:hypothetical protein